MSAEIERLKDEGTRQQVVIAGGIAGLVSRFVIAPLDVVKIRLQLQPHSLSDPLSCDGIKGPIYKGVFSTLRAIVRDEGIRALWKGNIPAELMYITYGGVQFTAYRSITQAQAMLPTRPPPSLESFISGAGAGAAATSITYPLDLLRTRFAAQGPEKIYSGLANSVQDILRREGPSGFFRGLSAALGQIVPYMGLFFMSYEFLHQYIGGKTLPFGSGDATAGVFASIFAKTAVFPLDLVRKRLQVQGPTRSRYIHTNIPEYTGVVRSLATIWRKEGYRGWYRGLTVSLIKASLFLSPAAPASAVTMWTYERVMHSLVHSNRNDEMWETYTGYDDDYDD
ncbi:mitochondrial thiamine pyrophosphate carrier 1 [Cladophialophora bantiana CBS 173.52]|uniref:Mitochondrial thiamine pyrophosphate carrier 1 n=1 Tax=Cladophialophora bantiana (strain ATCC 10958 / CBS 173.52 / CDC B-1940 / NIH 8579) TaxID=1442370 RepID=A0A0D2FLU7_CLAB1|nr:mitochondrial thiamine pyrophosphate carrier 1 [Cladophialophora bantiana CBS 173.52]KIW87697.1 mitochondrial thiamine pyrophosphate carrier 1 [Cladophialophora bantiana CBS 173.52]